MKTPASLIVSLFLALGPAAIAREWWASPAGSGAQDGSSKENAASSNKLQSFLDQLKPGDRLVLGGGEYRNVKLVLKSSGTTSQPITITGSKDDKNRPIFVADWTIATPDKGPIALLINPGVSHVAIANLDIRNYQFGIRAPIKEGAEPGTGLRFEGVNMEYMRHGFYLSGCADLKLVDCRLKRYSKHGFRCDAACTNVTFQRCVADCSESDPEWEKQTEALPCGFVVNDGGAPNTGFVFEDCISRNNLMPLQKNRYKNGDGFVVEGNTENVAFKRCISVNNQDGGYDLKVKDVRLDDCVAFRNKRDYRIWTTGKLTNCFAGWSPAGIWTKGGPVVVERCTIAGWKGVSVLTEDAPVGVELRNCLLAADGNTKDAAQLPRVTLVDCIQTADLAGAGLQRPPENWKDELVILESTKHRDKGYQARRK